MDDFGNMSRLHNWVRLLTGDQSVSVLVKGDCMMPWIESDTLVQVAPSRNYWPGDIVIVLSQQGEYLAHRVIGFYKKRGQIKILTQPDSSHQSDTAAYLDAVLGKVMGGDCHPYAVTIPLHHRLKALLRFGKVILRKVVKR